MAQKEQRPKAARMKRIAAVIGSGTFACALGAVVGEGDDEHAGVALLGGILALVVWSFVGLTLAIVHSTRRRRGRALPRGWALGWCAACAGIVGLSLSWLPKERWLEWEFQRASAWVQDQADSLDEQLLVGREPRGIDLADAPAGAKDGRFAYSLSGNSYELALRGSDGWWHVWQPGEPVLRLPWRP